MPKKIIEKIVYAALIVYCLLLIRDLVTEPERFQWDFGVYYYAAKAYVAEMDPYSPAAVAGLSGNPGNLSFVYPPLILPAFRLFLNFGYEMAYYLYLALKFILLIALVLLWRNNFVRDRSGLLFYLICIFGFGGTIAIDIITGNISIIEQTLLWFGFLFLIKEKYLLFTILALAASLFKLTPVAFLILLPLFDRKKGMRYLVWGLTAFCVYLILNYLIFPELSLKFMVNSTNLDERGMINPSTYSLILYLFDLFGSRAGIQIPSWIAAILYMGLVAVILIYSGKVISRFIRSDIKDKNLILLYFACVVFALVMPRFKNYSFILLLIPAYYIIKNTVYRNVLPFMIAAILLTVPNKCIPDMGQNIFMAIWDYSSLMLTYGLWALYLQLIGARMNEKIIIGNEDIIR